jgi:hypothetical protein
MTSTKALDVANTVLKHIKEYNELAGVTAIHLPVAEEVAKRIDAAYQRQGVLLKAAYDLLAKANESNYVEQATAIVVHYDGADCDGNCLMEDIAAELEIEDDPEKETDN